ncbi:hypothetical protein [Pontibacter ruber]|uniref:SWFGD domain-containing protein n=1 Tax=Pontibacter ruber TaxID=1343895 RepID=A0ABW5CZ94_9BACT|nr:hypothetical protein [Pontibacter ruber]
MRRYERERYENGNYGHENSYRDERHYRPARGMQDNFEREYQQQHRPRYQPEDRYERRDTYHSPGYTRDMNYDESFRGSNRTMGDIRQGYGISSFDGISDRYNTLNRDQRGGNMQEDQAYYGESRYSSTGYGSGMGESFPNSNRGVPNYGLQTFADNYGTGMGSSYGGANYGGGTGYISGNRGGSSGNYTYGTSSGNYGGYGSMGGGTYGGGMGSGFGGSSSHNSDRGTTDLGGF